MIEAFPLHWPLGYPRTSPNKKIYSQFKCTLAQARDGIMKQVELMNGKDIVISTNIPVKRDGFLYASGKPVDNDHGVAVYFTWRNDQVVLACDQYVSLWENLRAIEKSVEAMRKLEKYGCSDILSRTFSGFKTLEAPGSADTWYEYMGISKNSTVDQIKKRYRTMAKEVHPDNPNGSDKAFKQLNIYYNQALKTQ